MELNMRTLCVAVLGTVMVIYAGTARAEDDNSKKIVGVWEVTKSVDLPVGATIEFTKDGKLLAVLKDAGGETKLDGTYKIEKDKLTVKVKISDKEVEEEATIRKLTDDALEVEDKDKKVDVFKKKK
jgi:uncharacterized protein (TIGR03066 family)